MPRWFPVVLIALVAVLFLALFWRIAFVESLGSAGGRVSYLPFFGLFGGLFLIMIIFMLVRLTMRPRMYRGGGGAGYGRRRAMYILRERYARGEITKEQFDEMRRNLRNRDEETYRDNS